MDHGEPFPNPVTEEEPTIRELECARLHYGVTEELRIARLASERGEHVRIGPNILIAEPFRFHGCSCCDQQRDNLIVRIVRCRFPESATSSRDA